MKGFLSPRSVLRCIARFCVALVVLCFGANTVAALSDDAPGCPLRKLDPAVAAISRNSAMVSTLLQGATGYAGDEPGARPLPPWTLHDLQQRLQQPAPPGVLAFAFFTGNAQSSHRDILTISKSAAYCLLKPGDTLLLSDRVTAHYTSLYGFDADSGAAYLVDPWPDTLFLLPGRNAADVHAVNEKIGQKTLTRVSRDEILRVLRGFITFDTVGLAQRYFASEPGASGDPRVLLALGSTVLEATGRPAQRALLPEAVAMLEMASRQARQREQPELVEATTSMLGLALSYERLEAVLNHDGGLASEKELKLRLLGKLPGGDRIESRWTPDDWYGLGLAAGRAQEYAASVRFFGEAIRTREDFAAAYLWRANSRLKSGLAADALEDVNTALTLIRRERSALTLIRREQSAMESAEDVRRSQLGEMERTGVEIERLARARGNP